MLATIARRYGQAERIWVMDRGVPTEDILGELRSAQAPVRYLVGTAKGRLTRYEAAVGTAVAAGAARTARQAASE